MKKNRSLAFLFMLLLLVNGHVAGQSAKTNQTNLFSSSFETLDSLAVANRIANINLARSYARQAYQVSLRSRMMKNVIRANYLLAITSNPKDKDSSFFKLHRALTLSKRFNMESESSNILYSLELPRTSARVNIDIFELQRSIS